MEKSQDIRVYDFIFLGPFMIWFGLQAKNVPDWTKVFMISAGIGTILYNYSTYSQNLK